MISYILSLYIYFPRNIQVHNQVFQRRKYTLQIITVKWKSRIYYSRCKSKQSHHQYEHLPVAMNSYINFLVLGLLAVVNLVSCHREICSITRFNNIWKDIIETETNCSEDCYLKVIRSLRSLFSFRFISFIREIYRTIRYWRPYSVNFSMIRSVRKWTGWSLRSEQCSTLSGSFPSDPLE